MRCIYATHPGSEVFLSGLVKERSTIATVAFMLHLYAVFLHFPVKSSPVNVEQPGGF